jgi:histidine triad (HIT) family protein
MSDIYCDQILNGKLNIPAVFESELVIAFHHTQPYFEHHIVIVPKQHIDSLSSSEAINPELALEFITAIHHVTSMLEKECGGCCVSSNIGSYQTTKHLHWYVHFGKRLRNEDGSQIAT